MKKAPKTRHVCVDVLKKTWRGGVMDSRGNGRRHATQDIFSPFYLIAIVYLMLCSLFIIWSNGGIGMEG